MINASAMRVNTIKALLESCMLDQKKNLYPLAQSEKR